MPSIFRVSQSLVGFGGYIASLIPSVDVCLRVFAAPWTNCWPTWTIHANIQEGQWEHAHRLFQCLAAAIRPLCVEELAEIFAVEFDAVPNLMEGRRPEIPNRLFLPHVPP